MTRTYEGLERRTDAGTREGAQSRGAVYGADGLANARGVTGARRTTGAYEATSAADVRRPVDVREPSVQRMGPNVRDGIGRSGVRPAGAGLGLDAAQRTGHDEPEGRTRRWMDLRSMHNLPLKLVFSCLGIVLISLGAAICATGGFGVGLDPFTAMNMGLSEIVGIRFGTFQLIVNLAILAVVFFLDKYQIGIGTIVNMVAVGYLIEFFTWVYGFVPHLPDGILRAAVHIVAGTLVFTLGVSMYLKTRMGVSPIDAVAPIASAKTGARYTVCRVIQDITVAAIALFAGGPVGAFTIVAAFFTGPLITAWNRFVTLPLYERTGTLDALELDEERRALVKRPKRVPAGA